jgi:DNA-binding beta-propeller fold protein YncE
MKVWAGWLGLTAALSLGLAGCSNNTSTPATISISPTSGTVLLGTSFQFIPSESGSQNGIQWSVDGINNGNATVGTIDSTGLYTAPAVLPVPPSAEIVPVVVAIPNSSIPNSGLTGTVIQLHGGFDFTNFAAGNTITITGNSAAFFNGSFVIQAVAPLPNGNFGVQIITPPGATAPGTGGSATVVEGITISAQIINTSAVATATLTLDSGIRVALSQTTYTIGTGEQYLFAPTAEVFGTSNQSVIWSVSGSGTIDPTSGLFVAGSATGTATVTATSVVDPTQSASATVTVVTATDPTITSISPPNGALGAAFQQVFITGTNFISTTVILVNGTPLPSGALFSITSTSLFVSMPNALLAGPNATLAFTVSRQNGAPQTCSPSPSACQLVLSPVRPAIVASKPDSIPISSSGSSLITLDGGYFGTANHNVINLAFNGSPLNTFSFLSDPRQIQFKVPSVTSTGPGLYPITVASTVSGSTNGSMAAVNLAVQPSPTVPSPSTITVGTSPAAIAINTATGFAVVADAGKQQANGGGHNIALVNLTTSTAQFMCTEAVGSGVTGTTETTCPGSGAAEPAGPVSVAVDNLRNIALVANNSNATLAVVNLNTQTVTALLSFPSADPTAGAPFNLVPLAVGINPVSGLALVAFTAPNGTGSNAGAILDMNQLQTITGTGTVTLPALGSAPGLISVVNISNGLNPHIAVSTTLNWALVTPGGVGALSIVDMGRRTTTTNQITAISCTPGVSGNPSTVSVTTATTHALQPGQPVLISGVSPNGFNGIFSVSASPGNNIFQYHLPCPATSGAGGAASYANPVASVGADINIRGVSINDVTQKALLADISPLFQSPVFEFDLLNQNSTNVQSLPQSAQSGTIATAINPLTNVGVAINQGGVGYIIDASTPSYAGVTFTTGSTPVDVAIDPVTDVAAVVNQGSNNLQLFPLGAVRSPQILQSPSQLTLTSSLTTPASIPDQPITLIGQFTSNSVPRLDGSSSAFVGSPTISANGRMLTATISGAALAANGPRNYVLDVLDSSTSMPSNAAQFQVIQAVSLVTSDCSNPQPQGVAINSALGVAIVTEPGCNDVSMVNLSPTNQSFPLGTGYGSTPELAVQSSPQGVDVYAQSNLAVVANQASNSVSIVDMANDAVPTSFGTAPLPAGVAIDQGTGTAVVTANGASVVDTFPVSTASQTPGTIAVQQSPSGVAVDSLRGLAVVANSASGSNNLTLLDLTSSSALFNSPSGGIVFPQGVAFDPINDQFMITSSASNQVFVFNPFTDQITNMGVGIGPSSIAYNPESGTLVTANSLSKTVSVVDFIDRTVRGVFSLPSSSQFAVAIHPQTNLAVVADPVDNQLLLVPLPH